MKQAGRAARRCSLHPAMAADARQRRASHAIDRVARSRSAPGARSLARDERMDQRLVLAAKDSLEAASSPVAIERERRHGSKSRASSRAAPAELQRRPSCSEPSRGTGRVAAPAGSVEPEASAIPESQSNRKPGDPKEHALRSRGSLDVWQERLITSHGLARWFDSMGSMDATPSRRDRSPSARESRNPTLDVNGRATTGS